MRTRKLLPIGIVNPVECPRFTPNTLFSYGEGELATPLYLLVYGGDEALVARMAAAAVDEVAPVLWASLGAEGFRVFARDLTPCQIAALRAP